MWVEDKRYWGASFVVEGRKKQVSIADDPISRLVQVLREKGFERGCIGGPINIEDTMLVTKDGAEGLTDMQRDLEAYA